MLKSLVDWLFGLFKTKPKPDVVFYDGNGDERRVPGTGDPGTDALIAASLSAGMSTFHRCAPIPEEWLTLDLTSMSDDELHDLDEKCCSVSDYEYPETPTGTGRALQVETRIAKEFERRRMGGKEQHESAA